VTSRYENESNQHGEGAGVERVDDGFRSFVSPTTPAHDNSDSCSEIERRFWCESAPDLGSRAVRYRHRRQGEGWVVWKLRRETLRANQVDIAEAAAELQSDPCHIAAALAAGEVLENGAHCFCATLEQFIAARNARGEACRY
jgi:hypothetical protein